MALKTVFRSALTASDTTAVDTLGDVREDSDGKRYKYCKFTIASTAGNLVKYVGDDTDYLTNEVGQSATADVVAGVAVVTHIADNFGWVQSRGRAVLNIAVVSGAQGSMFSGNVAVAGGATIHTGALQHCGVSITTTTAVLLQCPD